MPNSEITLTAVLQDHLHSIAKSEGFTDYTVEHDKASNDGDGFRSAMLSVTLVGQRQRNDGTHGADRLSLICKLLSRSESPQHQIHTTLAFDREALVYTEILPAIERFQIAKGLTPTERFMAYPKCYLAKAHSPTEDALIIMEDMRKSGHVMWGKSQPLPFANAKLLIEQLGHLHGVSVALRDQQPEEFAKWTQMPDIYNELMTAKMMQALYTSSFDRAIGLLENERHIEMLNAFRRDFLAINVKLMDKEVLTTFGVFSHGDCWNNNIMYASDESVTMLDWQLSRITSPAVDLSYFLFSSTEKCMRDQHMDELIRLYYAKFAHVIRRCGSDPEKLYTFGDLQTQLRTFGFYGLLAAPILIPVMVSDASDLASMDKLAEDVEFDNESKGTHLALLNKRSEEQYKRRLSDALDDAIKYGWLAHYVM